MICKKYCREAGKMNDLLNSGTVPKMLTEEFMMRIKWLHKQCRGGTWCDCQHKLGKHLSLPTG